VVGEETASTLGKRPFLACASGFYAAILWCELGRRRIEARSAHHARFVGDGPVGPYKPDAQARNVRRHSEKNTVLADHDHDREYMVLDMVPASGFYELSR
jgi:hypothetical protein